MIAPVIRSFKILTVQIVLAEFTDLITIIVRDRNGTETMFDVESLVNRDPLTGEIQWVPTLEQAGKTEFAVVVDDLHGGKVSQTIEIAVSSAEPQPVANAN